MNQFRERAIAATVKELETWSDEVLDDFIRPILGIQPRPDGNPPWGWLTPISSKPSVNGISEAGIALIKKWEGFRGKAYRDPVGIWTIGYGHIKGVLPGHIMSEPEADKLLREEVQSYETAVLKSVKVPLSQNQKDALISFTYNVGIGAFQKSTLLRVLNQGNYQGAADQLLRWNKGGGKVLAGLTNRRREERSLFLR